MRIIFRFVEFSQGVNSSNPILTHEGYTYGLDALPMLLAAVILNIVHPGLVLKGPESDFPRQTRKEKKAAKKEKKEAKQQEKNGKKAAKEIPSRGKKDMKRGVMRQTEYTPMEERHNQDAFATYTMREHEDVEDGQSRMREV
jgi:hypothetical protein